MSEIILIRKAEITDLEQIENFSQRLIAFDTEFDDTMDISWSKSVDGVDFFKSRINAKDGVVYLAVVGNTVAGCLVGGMTAPHSYRTITRLAEIEEIFVVAEYRSKKVGAKLIDAFELWCQQNNVERIKVEVSAGNARGIKFYQRIGFDSYNMILEKKLK